MTTDEQLRRTPLFSHHRALGAKMVPFGGWEMPVQYSGLIEEHRAVRTGAGIFDVSHMGEIYVTGPEAERALNYLTCNDVAALTDGKAQYSAILNERGGVVDDIIVYRHTSERYLVCVNASNAEKDFEWFASHNRFDAVFDNMSPQFGQIAIQGPRAAEILTGLLGLADVGSLTYFGFATRDYKGVPVVVARTGYTGEDGFEVFLPWNDTPTLWEDLIATGQVVPAGLGARDTLRLEAGYPLHGHELGEDVSALESGLGWIVKLSKADFIGREALAREKSEGRTRGLVGFFVEDQGIARHGDVVCAPDGASIGVVTSGTKTPTVNRALGLALVDVAYAAPGKEVKVRVRGRELRCTTTKPSFYSALKK